MGTPNHNQQAGFTLVEMIMVIVITGIIGGMVAMFLKAPIQQYMDVARRAELTDIADTAVRRMARDVRIAVPNSVRTAGCGGTPCVEFLPTIDGGRYRASGPGDTLIFDGTDTAFDVIGTANIAENDYVVVGSTQSDGSIAYEAGALGGLRRVSAVSGVAPAVTGVTLASGLPSTAELSTQRFAVVAGTGTQGAVTYACIVAGGGACPNTPVVGDGTCQLVRFSNYGINQLQNLSPPATAIPNPPVLADRVSFCQIEYEIPATPATVVFPRFGLLAVRLTLTSGGESVSLYNEIHVNNAP